MNDKVQQIPKGYKQTEAGVIPEDWDITPLRDLIRFTNGKAHEQNIVEYGDYIVINSKFISSEGEVKKYSNECIQPVSKNEITMVMSDVPNGKAIAKCFIVDKDNTYTLNQRICAMKSLKDDDHYLFLQVNRNPYFLSFDDGVKQTNLKRDEVLNCLIKLPQNKTEQQTIAKVIFNIDKLIFRLEKLISKKKAIKQGVMQELLIGKKRLPGYKEKWELKPLAEVVTFINGKPYEPYVVNEGKYDVITLDSIAIDGKLKQFHKKTNYYDSSLKKDDIVIVLSDIAHALLLGLCDLIPQDNKYVLNQRMGRLRPIGNDDPKYIRIQINYHQNHFRTRGQGTSQCQVPLFLHSLSKEFWFGISA